MKERPFNRRNIFSKWGTSHLSSVEYLEKP